MKLKIKFILIFMLILCINSFATAQTNKQNSITKKTIIVACVKDSGYIEKNSLTTYKGYLVDYLNKVGELYNLHFRYTLVDSNEECLNLVKTGVADISCLQYKTKTLENIFSFSNEPIITLSTNLYTLADDNKYFYEDFNNFDDIVVGIREDLSSIEDFYQYSINNNFSFTLKKYQTEKAIHKALINGEINALVSDYSLFSNIKLKKIGEISHNKTYIIAKKDNPIINEINKSLNWIIDTNPNIFKYLTQKHLNNEKAITEFTKEEALYIDNSDIIKVGLLPDNYVQNRYNEETDEFEGILVDYMKEISKLSNLKFEFIQIPYGLNVQDAIGQGFCDISPNLSRNESTLNDDEIVATINFITMKQLIAVNKNNPISFDEIKYISAPSNYQGLLNHIYNEHPQWEIVKTKTNKILEPLLAEIVDVAVGNEYELKYLMQSPKYSNLVLTESYLTDILLSIGINSNNDSRLLSILNKSISNINSNQIEYFKTKGMTTNYKYTFFDSYYSNSNFFNLVILIISATIVCLILFVRYQKQINSEIRKKESELNVSNKKFEKANKAKSEFLASMSHDLRTPMNAIIGLTELSKNNINDVALIKQYIDKIDISSKYLLSLINDILDISAIEDNKLTISETPLNLKTLVFELTNMYNVNSQQKNIIFQVHINRIYHENLIGDYLRIKQIVTNLLSNAFKYTPRFGCVELIINETTNGKDSLILDIKVRDTGIGIPKNLQNKIFQKFVQADSRSNNQEGESGLGLSIVSNLVSLMKGTITLESHENKGSTFCVKIPLKINNNSEKVITIKDNKKFKILIVDNDIKSNLSINNTLNYLNIENSYAININEALIKAQKEDSFNTPYNVLIIDSSQTDGDSKFKSSQLYNYFSKESKYIVLSSYEISYLKDSISSNHYKYYIEKPIFISSIIQLFKIIQRPNLNFAFEYFNQNLEGMRILLCEDNQINQLVGKKLLETFKAKVTIAENGSIGVQTLFINNAQDFDLILMDIRMPEMDGYEATKIIRSSFIEKCKTIPIYAMTANVTKEDIENCIKFGMNGHIPKPIDKNKLFDILKKEWDKIKNNQSSSS